MQGVAENSCLIIGTEDPEDFEILDESEIEKLRRVQKKLNHALKILGVKISTFNALYTKGKAVALRELLDTHLSKLLNPDPPIVIHPPKYLVKAKNAVEYNPNFKPADLPTIHEAYQFLLKNYVESCKNESQTQFLTLAQIKVNNERRLMKERNEGRKNSFQSSSDNSTPNSSGASSRRNSQISVKVTKKNLKKSKQDITISDEEIHQIEEGMGSLMKSCLLNEQTRRDRMRRMSLGPTQSAPKSPRRFSVEDSLLMMSSRQPRRVSRVSLFKRDFN